MIPALDQRDRERQQREKGECWHDGADESGKAAPDMIACLSDVQKNEAISAAWQAVTTARNTKDSGCISQPGVSWGARCTQRCVAEAQNRPPRSVLD